MFMCCRLLATYPRVRQLAKYLVEREHLSNHLSSICQSDFHAVVELKVVRSYRDTRIRLSYQICLYITVSNFLVHDSGSAVPSCPVCWPPFCLVFCGLVE